MHIISDSTRRASTFRGKGGRRRVCLPVSQNVERSEKRPRALCWSYVIAIIDEMFVERAWKFSNWEIYIYIYLFNLETSRRLMQSINIIFFSNYDGIYIKIISSRSRVTNKFSSSRHRNPRFYFFFSFFILFRNAHEFREKVCVLFPLLILVFFFPFFPRYPSLCYTTMVGMIPRSLII